MPHGYARLNLLSPRYFSTWILLGILWLCVKLPYHWQCAMGRLLGRAALPFAHYRREITRTNLKLCFPSLCANEQDALLKRCFMSAGVSVFETAMAWWMPKRRFDKLVHLEGLEHLEQALAKGHGAIILIPHFTTLEPAGRLLATHITYDGVYRPHKNPVLEWFMRKTREDHIHKAIPRKNVKQFLNSLKNNRLLAYAPDQDYGRKHSVFAPFFGVQAATITTTARMAKMRRTVVLPYFFYRLADGKGYSGKIHPPLDHFPSNDAYQDALRINQVIEEAILKAPEQYLWAHRRFKTRPLGEKSVYEKKK
jgi:KDO2-lipid IV(A) lauroyltransferase